MNQYEVASVIGDAFPQLHAELRHLAVLGNVYESLNMLTKLTRNLIVKHHFGQVRRCMKVAEHIYNRGNPIVRNAVENIFVYSFSTMRTSCNKVEWRVVQSVIPVPLYLIYIKQVNCSAS